MQQRNGRKSLTTVQGISKSFDYKRLLKDFKKVSQFLRDVGAICAEFRHARSSVRVRVIISG